MRPGVGCKFVRMKGYLFQPPVTGFEEDQTWGEINGLRYPINNGNLLVKKGRMFKDVILQRDENKYWKWTIYDFEFKTLFFIERAIGEWEVKKLSKPEDNAKKISLGKMNKFKEENALLTQAWVMEPKKKVQDVLKELAIADLKIKEFYRIKIGE